MAKQPTKAKKKTMQQAAPFASFMGLHLEDQRKDDEKAKRAEKEEEWAKKAETDPDREQLEDESDDDYAARMEEMDEEEKAEGEIIEPDPDAEEDEDDEKPNAKAARASERKRCARIIAHGVKAGNVHQAAVFAFDTNLTASQAISAMNAAKMAAPSGGLGGRMQGVPNYQVGTNAGGNDQGPKDKSTAQANSILDALEVVRGK